MIRLKLSGPSRGPKRTWGEWLLWIAAEDHCEWANRYVAWLKTPLGILLSGAVCSLLCGLFVAPQGYAMFAAIVAVVMLGLAWPWIAVRAVSARLTFEARRGREGKTASAKLVVNNRWPWPVWGLSVNDPLLAGDDQSEAVVALARIDGWSRSTFNCPFTPPQRGLYPRHEIHIATGFPFGLYQASRPVDVGRQLVVWPQTFWLPPLANCTRHHDWRGELTDSCVGSEGTRLGVRDHRHGDSLRDVHWAKSARYDRLIVSEREAAAVDNLTVLVDIDPERHAGLGRSSTLEWSLRIAASICESVVGQRGNVDLWLGGERLCARGLSKELERLLDGVATFDAQGDGKVGNANWQQRWGASPTISIGTDSSPIQAGRFICVHDSSVAARASAELHLAEAWVAVDSQEDVAGRVLVGWRSDRRRPCSAK